MPRENRHNLTVAKLKTGLTGYLTSADARFYFYQKFIGVLADRIRISRGDLRYILARMNFETQGIVESKLTNLIDILTSESEEDLVSSIYPTQNESIEAILAAVKYLKCNNYTELSKELNIPTRLLAELLSNYNLRGNLSNMMDDLIYLTKYYEIKEILSKHLVLNTNEDCPSTERSTADDIIPSQEKAKKRKITQIPQLSVSSNSIDCSARHLLPIIPSLRSDFSLYHPNTSHLLTDTSHLNVLDPKTLDTWKDVSNEEIQTLEEIVNTTVQETNISNSHLIANLYDTSFFNELNSNAQTASSKKARKHIPIMPRPTIQLTSFSAQFSTQITSGKSPRHVPILPAYVPPLHSSSTDNAAPARRHSFFAQNTTETSTKDQGVKLII